MSKMDNSQKDSQNNSQKDSQNNSQKDSQKPKHSPIGASSMHRWANCPGSVNLSKGIEQKVGIAALEGTAAHEMIGLAMQRAFSENKPTKAILDDHFKAIELYSSFVESLRKEMKNPVTHVEHSFDMSAIYPNLYGTADCVIFDNERKILFVIDYKHGSGLPVEVNYNLQLSYYALGAVSTLPYKPKHVELIIVQPRCYHPDGFIRRQRLSILYFLEFKQTLIEAAKKTEQKDAKLVRGEHCIFCPAKKICPASFEDNLEKAKKEFSEFKFYKDPKSEFQKV